MGKCNFVKGGYADDVCEALQESIEGSRQTKKSKGLYSSSVVEYHTRKRLGVQIKLKSGEFVETGICLNFCPFCGGGLRDTSED